MKKEKLYAVSHVSFSLKKGECLGIVGESGCGKSTVARMIAGIIPVSGGEVLLEGEAYMNLKGSEKRRFRRNIQMVFQDPLSSFSPRMKVGTYLMESRRNFDGISKENGLKEARKLLLEVGLPEDFVNRYPHELSGGQLQRVAIARAISIQPKLLICDEATGALDVSIQNQIAKLLVKLVEEWKELLPQAEIIPISATSKFNVDYVMKRIKELLPDSPPYFGKDQWTDKPARFFVNEIIREKILLYYDKEIPYSVEVVVEEFKEEPKKIHIRAVINVERDSQKGIIIGKQGKALKKVATEARRELERFFGKTIFLETYVKVDKDWRSSDKELRNFGYQLD